jgi:hypothetical protein
MKHVFESAVLSRIELHYPWATAVGDTFMAAPLCACDGTKGKADVGYSPEKAQTEIPTTLFDIEAKLIHTRVCFVFDKSILSCFSIL